MCFYSQWEIPTLLHGQEFHNATVISEVSEIAGETLMSPDFIKVVRYSKDEAEILWVSHGQHYLVEMLRTNHHEKKLTKWKISEWHICTPKNGSPSCFFPWYGGLSTFIW
jgi:hypothetical protein